MSFPPFTCWSSGQGEFLHPAASELQRDRPNLMKRPLRLEANDNALARLSRRDQRSTLVKRRDDCGKLLFQLEYLPGRRMLDHLAGGASTPLHGKTMLGRLRAIHRSRPPAAHSAFRADNFYHMMMFETGQRLRDHGIGTILPPQHGREVIVHASPGGFGVAEGLHARRVPTTFKPPHDHVEEVHRLLEDPRADPALIVPPIPRAAPVREAKQAHHRVEGMPNLTIFDQLLDGAPLGRQAELVADAEDAAGALNGFDHAIALGDADRHGLLKQDTFAGLERGNGHLGVQMVGYHDVNGIDGPLYQEGAPITMDRHLRVDPGSSLGTSRTATCDRGQDCTGRLSNGLRVQSSPRTKADQPKTHGAPPPTRKDYRLSTLIGRCHPSSRTTCRGASLAGCVRQARARRFQAARAGHLADGLSLSQEREQIVRFP